MGLGALVGAVGVAPCLLVREATEGVSMISYSVGGRTFHMARFGPLDGFDKPYVNEGYFMPETGVVAIKMLGGL